MLTFATLWNFASGFGGILLAGLAAVAGLGAWGWQRERKGRRAAQTEAELKQHREVANATQARLDVERQISDLGPDGVRQRLRDRWSRPDH